MGLIKNPFMRIWQTAFMVKSIEPVTAIALAQGGGRFLSTLFGKRKRRDFIQTAQGQQLQRESEEGVLNQAAQRQITGEVAATTGNIAQIQRAQARGRLAAQGITGSGAGERALAAPGIAQQEAVASTSQQLATQNELSKARARRELAAGIGRTEEAQDVESAQFRSNLISSATSAVAGIIEGKAIDETNRQALESIGTAEQNQRIRLLLQAQIALGAGAQFTQELIDAFKAVGIDLNKLIGARGRTTPLPETTATVPGGGL